MFYFLQLSFLWGGGWGYASLAYRLAQILTSDTTLNLISFLPQHTYKVHPDKTKFTQVTDSPVLVQAQVNSKQLSDVSSLKYPRNPFLRDDIS